MCGRFLGVQLGAVVTLPAFTQAKQRPAPFPGSSHHRHALHQTADTPLEPTRNPLGLGVQAGDRAPHSLSEPVARAVTQRLPWELPQLWSGSALAGPGSCAQGTFRVVLTRSRGEQASWRGRSGVFMAQGIRNEPGHVDVRTPPAGVLRAGSAWLCFWNCFL